MAKLTTCKSYGKEVAKAAKICPHCGAKLRMGLFTKILLASVFLGIALMLSQPSKEERAAKQTQIISELESATAADISPQGELAKAFSFNSEYTNVQRENLENDIKGKIVQWTLPLYEVKKNDSGYTLQTSDTNNTVGVFARVHIREESERDYIESLKTGASITLKGKITGTFLRNIELKPAIVIR